METHTGRRQDRRGVFMKTRYKILATCFNKYGIPLSKGENSYKKTHPLQAYFAERVGHPQRIYLHAEILALIRAGDKKIYRDWETDRKSTRLNSSHSAKSRMPSSA